MKFNSRQYYGVNNLGTICLGLALMGCVLVLSACAVNKSPAPLANTAPEQVPPPALMLANDVRSFSCRDGQRFVIAFYRDKKTAQLILANKSVPEDLYESQVGAGSEYQNDRFSFSQHAGYVTLEYPDQRQTICRMVK